MEEQLEQIEVQQHLMSKREVGGRMGESAGGQGHHAVGGGRTSQSQVDGWNTLTKTLDAVCLRKVLLSLQSEPTAKRFSLQLDSTIFAGSVFMQDLSDFTLFPGSNKDVSPVWKHGCSGGSAEQGEEHLKVSCSLCGNGLTIGLVPDQIPDVWQPPSASSQASSGPAHCSHCLNLNAK